MANPNRVRRLENPRPNRGQEVQNAGAIPREFKRKRDDVLAEIAMLKPSECPDYATIHQMAMEKLGALIHEGDGPTIRWYFDQQIGGPKSTITYMIESDEIVKACSIVQMERNVSSRKKLTVFRNQRVEGSSPS
jgi:hypothetical protein